MRGKCFCYGGVPCAECDAIAEARREKKCRDEDMLVRSQHMHHKFRVGNRDLAILMQELREQLAAKPYLEVA